MQIKPIRTEAEYEAAMNRVDELWGTPVNGSPEAEELDVLLALTGAYERKHHRYAPPSTSDLYEYHLDRLGFSSEQIINLLENREKLSKIIVEAIGLPADQLEKIGDVPLKVFTAG
jgi:HTH-type transcriptional regulator/antitoxin HigA